MIMSRPDPSVAVRALKSAAPYIRMYKNKVFVIKAGGAVFSDEISTRALIEQVAILHQVGIKTVLVHGGGPQLDQLQATLGHRDPDGQRPARHRSEVHRRDAPWCSTASSTRASSRSAASSTSKPSASPASMRD